MVKAMILTVITLMAISFLPVFEQYASAQGRAITVSVDFDAVSGKVPKNFLSTGKYTTDATLQGMAKNAGFSLIRIDCLLDGVEAENDDADAHHFNWDGFQWGRNTAQYGADLDEVVSQMVENGQKPIMVMHRTQSWNARAGGDWRSVPVDMEEWAEACAATVHHFNIDMKLESNTGRYGTNQTAIMNGWAPWNMYIDLVSGRRQMKEVDSTIKVGGPALSWADANTMKKVIQDGCGFLDFYSWHAYGTGGDDSD